MTDDPIPIKVNELDIIYTDPESYVRGLNPTNVTFSGTWLPDDQWGPTNAYSFSARMVSKPKGSYSGKLFRFEAILDGISGEVCKWEMWFPITDRRLARRIARREGMRFTKVGGNM